MSSELSGSMVFDTSVLMELALDSPMSNEVRDGVLTRRVQPLTGEMNVMELSYLLCRRIGKPQASRTIGYLRKAGQIRIVPSSSFLDHAAMMKCGRSMSLVDCVTVSMGESFGVPVLFAKHEKELDAELMKQQFKVKMLFMNELIS